MPAIKTILTVALLMLALPALAQNPPARMDALATLFVQDGAYMGAVLVAKDDRVLLNKAYGFANLEWKIANTPSTKFRLGSVTKQFTAAAILMLEERGKLKIADRARTYLPDLPASWDAITIAQLLSHTGGVPNYTNDGAFMKVRALPATPQALVDVVKDKKLDFAPGEGWNYSNTGYVVLGMLIETISGESYEKFLADNIFAPLGMTDTGYDSHLTVLPQRAAGYAPGPQNADYIDMTVPYAAGALYSTTGDLLRWQRGLFGGKVLKPATLARMTTAVRDDYALGVNARMVAGHRVISHGGGIDGFNTQLAHYPDDGLTVIVLGNLNGPGTDTLAAKLAAIALDNKTVTIPSDRRTVTVPRATLARYAGLYRVSATTTAEVTVQDGRLVLQMRGQPIKAPLHAASQSRFFPALPDGDVEFVGAGPAPAEAMLMHPASGSGAPVRAVRVTAQDLQRAAEAVAARRKAGTPDPRSEPMIRKVIHDIVAGTPDYATMAPGLADSLRQQIEKSRAQFTSFGAIKTATFAEVAAGGQDVFKVDFEKGAVTLRILIGADGIIETMGYSVP